MKTFLVALLLAVAVASAVADTTRIQQIPLQHRSADELIPLIKPLVGAGGGVSGKDYLLIVRATEEQIEQIESLIDALDKPPRRFLISVEQVRDDNRAHQQVGADGRVVIGNDGANSRVIVHGAKTSDRSGGSVRQQVSVMENQSAYIQLGQRIPDGSRLWVSPLFGVGLEESTSWIEVSTGFTVTPRLLPENHVQLTLRVQGETPSNRGSGTPQSIQTSNMETSVRIPLNEWVTIGSADEASSHSSGAIVHRTQSRGEESFVLRVHATLQ